MPASDQLRRTLRRTFGLDDLRPGQAEVIRAVLESQDMLAIMPTGAGKSLCYQLPALHLEGTTIVVSPLIALMKDQTDKLGELGLEAAQVNSAVPASEQSESLAAIEQAERDFVLTTPERLADADLLESLRRIELDFVVIDEAHCISQWGHDFRPAYLELRSALEVLGDPPVLALTATATPDVAEDIRRQLGRPAMRIFNAGIKRDNLLLGVERVTGDAEKQAELLRLVREVDGPMVVYVATVRHVGAVADFLEAKGVDAVTYHGRLPARRRHEAQEEFMSGAARVIVATNAFGMGIDKPDIRAVVHYDMPGSLEAYYQEAGRAGRDGAPARGVLLYDTRDRRTQAFFLGGRYPGPEDFLAIYRVLAGGPAEGSPLAEIQDAAPDVAKSKVRVILAALKDAGLARERRRSRFAAGRRDASDEQVGRVAQRYRARAESDRERLERMDGYGKTARCRWNYLFAYFGEERRPEPCGQSDNCLHPIVVPAAAAADVMVAPRPAPVPRVGNQVELPTHGVGEVIDTRGETIDVRFPDGSTGHFLAEFARVLNRDDDDRERDG